MVSQKPADSSPGGERKQVTAVFIDLVDFSRIASLADAEDLQVWLDDYYTQTRNIIESKGGEVTEYLGDGVVALFGLNRAEELAAAKAVDAALKAVNRVSAAFPGHGPVKLRAGVATGEVVIRKNLGRHSLPRVTGMVTTLAQRIQEKAGPGMVMLAESTQSLLRGAVPIKALPEQRLKGFDDAQTLFRVRDRVLPERIVLPPAFVGRDAERAAVAAAGGACLIVGPAGIGKTALARTIVAEAPEAAVLQASGLDTAASYQPFKDWLTARLGRDSPGLDGLATAFPALGEDEALALALILGLAEGQVLVARVSNLALKALIERSLWRALKSGLGEAGTLLAEDLHWFDAASLGALRGILEAGDRGGIRVLMTSREDAGVGAQLHGLNLALVTLGTLSEAEAEVLLDALGGAALAPRRRAELIARAAGVPLFLEQLYKSAAGAGGAEKIPGTLSDLLAARIDASGPAKTVLQHASVIGRNFTLPLLSALMPEADNLPALLDRASAEGVLNRLGEHEWEFAHALLQQSAYLGLLRKAREDYHGRIADLMQGAEPDYAARNPALLAGHLARAGRHLPAARAYLAASQTALMQGAFVDAEAHGREALALCRDAPAMPEATDLEIAAQTALGSILMQVQGFTAEPVREAFEAVLDLAGSDRAARGLDTAAALFGSFSHAIIAGEKARADKLSALLDGIAAADHGNRDAGEAELAARAARNCNCFYSGEFASQFEQIVAIRELYDVTRHGAMIARYGMDIFAAAQMFETPARAICGRPDLVADLVAETDAHQALLNIPVMQPYALIWGAVPLHYAGAQQAALERLRQGIATADAQEAAFWQLTGHTWAHIIDPDLTATREGVDRFGGLVAHQRAIGANLGVPYFSAVQAACLAGVGGADEALPLARRAREEGAASGLYCWFAEILRLHARVARAAGRPAEARAALAEALSVARGQGARLWELRATLDRRDAGEAEPGELENAAVGFPDHPLPELARARAALAGT